MNTFVHRVALGVFGAIIVFMMIVTLAWAENPQAQAQDEDMATPVPTSTGWEPPVPPPYTPPPPQMVIAYEVRSNKPRQPVKMQIWDDGVTTITIGDTTDTQQGYGYFDARISHTFALADAAGFFTLKSRYDRGNIQNDIYDMITLHRDNQIKTITIAELGGKGITPVGLLDMIAYLRQLAVYDGPNTEKYTGLPTFPPYSYKSKGPTIGYQIEAMGGPLYNLQIRADGKASLYTGAHELRTIPLPPEQETRLLEQIKLADLFNEIEEPSEQPDPNRTAIPLPTDGAGANITLTENGRSKEGSIVLGHDMFETVADDDLENMFESIFSYVDGQDPPHFEQGILGYTLVGYNREYWDMLIDRTGAVYLSGQYAGQLSEKELNDLVALFLQNNWFDLEYQYGVPNNQRIDKVQEVSVGFGWNSESNYVEAYSGAEVPPALDRILHALAELHERFQVQRNVEVGMPKAGQSNGLDYWGVVLLALTAGLAGVALRRASGAG